MEITLDKIDKTEGLIKVKLKQDDYQPGVSKKIKEYSKKAQIKGFRPGKVPPQLIKEMYGKSILAEEINQLLSDKLNAYLRESDLQFLGEPIPHEDSFDNLDLGLDQAKDFEFQYNVGFAEEFELKIDQKLKVEKPKIKVDKKVIDETIENLQRQFGEISNEEIAKAQDIIYGKVTSKDGGIDKEISIDLNDCAKGVDKKFIGKKVGEVVEFEPKKLYDDSHKLHHQLDISHHDFDELKGKLSLTIGGITRTNPIAVDQKLFDKTFGEGKVKTEDEFRKKVEEAVTENYNREEDQYFNYRLRNQLIEKAKINLPDSFLKKWLAKSDDKITDDVISEEYESYSKEIKWSLIKNKIIKDQSLKVENDEVVAAAKDLITAQFGQAGLGDQLGDKLDMFAQNYLQGENGENYMKIYNQVLNNKALDYVKSQINIKDKTVSLDDFRKLP
ncbi:MAG: trigger factor [Bacteroidota bacterium]